MNACGFLSGTLHDRSPSNSIIHLKDLGKAMTISTPCPIAISVPQQPSFSLRPNCQLKSTDSGVTTINSIIPELKTRSCRLQRRSSLRLNL
ncbi:hypothetical protein GDO81_006901 [Engystomops pustulosus]|uniref:Uncharacterized protein n=1 Tax=Engystomops pustulosus TaxID=76066 RepID=A0AAV7D061_ENGPU|nr:hypothetical protein GDO81_006901 [Engystomops pustulosus]